MSFQNQLQELLIRQRQEVQDLRTRHNQELMDLRNNMQTQNLTANDDRQLRMMELQQRKMDFFADRQQRMNERLAMQFGARQNNPQTVGPEVQPCSNCGQKSDQQDGSQPTN